MKKQFFEDIITFIRDNKDADIYNTGVYVVWVKNKDTIYKLEYSTYNKVIFVNVGDSGLGASVILGYKLLDSLPNFDKLEELLDYAKDKYDNSMWKRAEEETRILRRLDNIEVIKK